MNGAIFLDYVTGGLSAELRAGDILVVDNLSTHNNPAVRQALVANDVTLFHLHLYSPDLNPIGRRRHKAQLLTPRRWKRLKTLLDAVFPKDRRNGFKHSG